MAPTHLRRCKSCKTPWTSQGRKAEPCPRCGTRTARPGKGLARGARILGMVALAFFLLGMAAYYSIASDCKDPGTPPEDLADGCPGSADDWRLSGHSFLVGVVLMACALAFSWAWARHGLLLHAILAGVALLPSAVMELANSTTELTGVGWGIFLGLWALALGSMGLAIPAYVQRRASWDLRVAPPRPNPPAPTSMPAPRPPNVPARQAQGPRAPVVPRKPPQ